MIRGRCSGKLQIPDLDSGICQAIPNDLAIQYFESILVRFQRFQHHGKHSPWVVDAFCQQSDEWLTGFRSETKFRIRSSLINSLRFKADIGRLQSLLQVKREPMQVTSWRKEGAIPKTVYIVL